jgi:hypothetical protein
MNNLIIEQYRRSRALGVPAARALQAARWCADVRERWLAAEERGVVRFRVEPDHDNGDVLDFDCGHVERGLCERCERRFIDRVNSEGVYGIVAEVKLGHEWDRYTAAVWGFIGDDWEEGCEDLDVKGEALAVLESYELEQRAKAARYHRLADAVEQAAQEIDVEDDDLYDALNEAAGALRYRAEEHEGNLAP